MTTHKDALSSPFHNPHRHTLDVHDDSDDKYDQNPNPYFNKPHDRGPDTIPLVFKEGELGKLYEGSAEELASKAAVSTTMNSSKGGKK